MKAYLLAGLLAAGLPGCRTAPPRVVSVPEPVVGAAAAEAVARVRAVVGPGPLAADYLFEEASIYDDGQLWYVVVPRASCRNCKPVGNAFLVHKVSGSVTRVLGRK